MTPAATTAMRNATPGEQSRPSAPAPGSKLASLWTLYALTVRQHMHGRRWMVMGALFLVPAGLALLVRATSPNAPPAMLEFVLAQLFIPHALLPLVALIYASGIIQDEQEEQTITYLLVRPIPRWALYATKLLATWTTTTVLAVALTAITFAAVYVGADAAGQNILLRCAKTAAIHSLAVVSYSSLFGLMSLLTKRTLVVGVIYTAVVEGMLANMPFGIRLATVIYYTRLIAYHSMDFIVDMPYGQAEDVAADAWQLDVRNDPQLLAHPQLSTCLTVLLVGNLVCLVLASWMCARREFHVKTPEKD